jgi:hypothetical protein
VLIFQGIFDSFHKREAAEPAGNFGHAAARPFGPLPASGGKPGMEARPERLPARKRTGGPRAASKRSAGSHKASQSEQHACQDYSARKRPGMGMENLHRRDQNEICRHERSSPYARCNCRYLITAMRKRNAVMHLAKTRTSATMP